MDSRQTIAGMTDQAQDSARLGKTFGHSSSGHAFTWYWLADLCAHEGIPFVLGHALYMKAIHGGKAKPLQ